VEVDRLWGGVEPVVVSYDPGAVIEMLYIMFVMSSC